MIRQILVAGEATYPIQGELLSDLKPINFIFGTNGSGKTTVSRVIADPQAHPNCTLSWDGGRERECMVYNTDFIGRNFSAKMPGIFTLGEDTDETLGKIDACRRRIADLDTEISKLEATLQGEDGTGGKQGEAAKLRSAFEERCWKIKLKHDDHFSGAFEGYRAAKPKFCDKLLGELASNTAPIKTVDDLKKRASAVFEKGVERIAKLNEPSLDGLVKLEASAVLTKKVVGKEDVDIAALIKRVGNSDWVKEGVSFLEASSPLCPFCQQEAPLDLERQLADYFDETFISDVTAINELQTRYSALAQTALDELATVADSDNRYLDVTAFRAEVDRLSDRIELNKRHLEAKRKEPSRVVTLEGLRELVDAALACITSANNDIATHNTMVDNLAAERTTLAAEIWKCVLDESKDIFTEFNGKQDAVQKAINGLQEGLDAMRADRRNERLALAELERGVTSVLPTVNEINGILASFGFKGFKLATAGDKDNLYEIIRLDGSSAAETLSEGERSFITFLYFYHLIRGSTSSSGMTAERVVVFDDPVSSLDSDVLFIVSSLIKRVLEEACRQDGLIRQVFVLTHNIYFHKEVSFDPKRSKECRAHETFWIIRKLEDRSAIVGYDHNPIKTSYELLWAEVRDPNRSTLTIQNTLRRILENYFKILGNLDKDEIVDKFVGKDQQICASLFSWVNDGSHSAYEDLYISADAELVSRYLEVFRQIFEKTGHQGHYLMMMGGDPAEDVTADETPAVTA